MSVEGGISQVFWSALQIILLFISVLHFIFTLIVIRQVRLMTETLITQVAPALRALSIFYGLVSLGVVILFVWLSS